MRLFRIASNVSILHHCALPLLILNVDPSSNRSRVIGLIGLLHKIPIRFSAWLYSSLHIFGCRTALVCVRINQYIYFF